MGEVKPARPRLVKVKADPTRVVAAASKICEREKTAPDTERVLVVYGGQGASLYIESTPAPGRPAVHRRAS
ncbi:MAG: hypothetical protein U0228_12765 [Myxococcaceae bacterium]